MTKSKWKSPSGIWDGIKESLYQSNSKWYLFYARKDVGSGNLKNGPKKLVCNINWNIHDHPF